MARRWSRWRNAVGCGCGLLAVAALTVVPALAAEGDPSRREAPRPSHQVEFDHAYAREQLVQAGEHSSRRPFPEAQRRALDRKLAAERPRAAPDQPGPGKADLTGHRFAQAFAHAKQERHRRAADRESAKPERDRSRDAHRDESPAEALSLARERFRPALEAPRWDPLPLRDDERLIGFQSPFTALVERSIDGERDRALIQSDFPLRSEVGNGELAPVDLSLDEQADRWAPRNPLVDTTIWKNVGTGVSLSEHIEIRAADSSADPVMTEDKVFFANAGGAESDTDLLVGPEPLGVQFQWQLRSTRSPDPELYFDLPPGTELKLGETPGGAKAQPAVIVRDGKPIATIQPPAVAAADGETVPVSYSVTGSTLRVNIARGADIHYPLWVDPVIEQYNLGETGQPPDHPVCDRTPETGWFGYPDGWFGTSSAGGFSPVDGMPGWWTNARFHVLDHCPNGSNRLDVYSWQGLGYSAGEYAEWLRPAIRQSYIQGINFRAGHYPWWTCMFQGVWSPYTSTWDYGTWQEWPRSGLSGQSPWIYDQLNGVYNGNSCNYFDGNIKQHHPTAPTRGNSAAFGMIMTGSPHPGQYAASWLYGSVIWVDDYDQPAQTTAHQGVPQGWVERATPTVTANATEPDPGLGVRYFQFFYPEAGGPINGTHNSQTHDIECIGDRRDRRCPIEWAHSFNYTTDGAPEGVQTWGVRAADVTAKPATNAPNWTIKIDRSNPGVNLSGPLWDASENDEPVSVDNNLHIAASDPYSGVKSVEVKVDGLRKDFVEQTCDAVNGCPTSLERDWNYHTADYTPGAHTVTIIATDQLGHAETREFTVSTEGTSLEVSLDGDLWDSDQATIGEPSYPLTIEATGTSGGTGQPVQSVEVKVDNQRVFFDGDGCPDDNCDVTWDFNTADYTAGPHGIEIIVTDVLGVRTVEELSVTVKHISGLPPQTLDLASGSARLDGAVAGDQSGKSVAGVGDVNGDNLDDYALGSPCASNNSRGNSGSVHVAYGTPSGAPRDLASAPGFRVDGAYGNEMAGSAAAAAGDVNGDGFDDLLVGAPGGPVWHCIGLPLTTFIQGRVYVVFGGPTPSSVDLAALGSRGFQIVGPSYLWLGGNAPLFGARLSGPRAGLFAPHADVNGDGLDDVVIGSPYESPNGRNNAGTTYVVFGKTSTTPVDVVNGLSGNGFAIAGAQPSTFSGSATTPVGDFNGDDFADVALTAPFEEPAGRSSAGKAYVVYGKSDGQSVDLATLGSQGFPIYGASGDRLGSSIASLGDIDNDGQQDLAIGGHGAFVVRSRDTTEAIDFAAPDGAFKADPPSGMGYDDGVVAGAGDLNEDSISDLLVGFPSAQSGAGESYALLSQEGKELTSAPVGLTALPGQRGTRLAGSPGDRSGAALDGVDSGADGRPGILIGAPGASNNGRAGSGSTFVVPTSALAGSAAASPGSQIRHGCYFKTTPAYFYDRASDLPDKCRLTKLRNRERGQVRAARNGYKGGGAGWRHTPPVGGNIKRVFRPGKRLNSGPQPIYDADLKRIGSLEQFGKNRFRLYDIHGDAVYKNPRNKGGALRVEGTPCMAPGHDPGTYALLTMTGSPENALRGMLFITARSNLPSGALSRSASNNQVIDAGWLPCSRPSSFKRGLENESTTYGWPAFDRDNDLYASPFRDAHCNTHVGTDDDEFQFGDITTSCGFRYEAYKWPRYPDTQIEAAIQSGRLPRTVTVSYASTGVGGGGIARSVWAVDAGGINMTSRDQIDYIDHNVPCSHGAVAKWRFMSRQGLFGWLPVREADLPPAEHDSYVRDRAHGSTRCRD